MFCRNNQYLKIQKIHHKALPKVVFNSDDGYDELLQLSNDLPFTRFFYFFLYKTITRLTNLQQTTTKIKKDKT